MSASRWLMSAIPIALVVGVLTVGAATGSIVGATMLVLAGVTIGVATNRQIRAIERSGWIIVLLASIWFLKSTQAGQYGYRGAAVTVALVAMACVFVRWLQIGLSDADDNAIGEQADPQGPEGGA